MAHELCHALREGVGAERSRRYHHGTVRYCGHLLASELDQGVVLDGAGDRLGEALAVDGQGAACRDGGGAGQGQKPRAHEGKLSLELSGGRVGPVALEGVRADELGQIARVMGRGRHGRPHLIEGGGNVFVCERECALRAGQTRTDYRDLIHRNSSELEDRCVNVG